jgi:PAS domain S-box-containing protein
MKSAARCGSFGIAPTPDEKRSHPMRGIPEPFVHNMVTVSTARRPVNGTKGVVLFLFWFLSPSLFAVFQRASSQALPPAHGVHWPILTTAMAIVMLFFTWWQQMRHRRRIEGANQELKRAFEALQQSENKFRLLFERSADAVLLMDPAQGPRFIDCNDASVRLLGYKSKEEVLGLKTGGISSEYQPDGQLSSVKALEMINTAIREGSHRFEWRNVRADGSFIMSEAVMTPVPFGSQTWIVTIARDITERKAAEDALRYNELLLSSILDNISEGIYRSSPEHGLIFANKAHLNMFGYDSLADVRSVPRENLYARAEDRHRLLSELEKCGAFSRQEILYKRKNGTTFWGLVSSIAVFLPGTQSIDYHVGVITDITERKKAEAKIKELNQDLERRILERTAELQASEERMRTLVEHAPEAIVVFDADSQKFMIVNENATRLYQRDRAMLLGLTPLDVSPEFQPDGRRSVDAAREYIHRALDGETPVFDWVHSRPDGGRVTCEIRLVRLPAQDQKLVRASIIDTSESQRKQKIQQATYEISEAVHKADDLKNLYERIHSIIKGLMPADNFYLVLHKPETGFYHFDYFIDEIDPVPVPRQMTSGLNAYVIRTGKALLATRDSMLDPASEWKTDMGTPSAVWLGVPLASRGKLFGVMALQDYKNERAYGEEEKQILTFVAEQTALAIERKRAERALRESEEKHRALFEATSQGVMLHDEKQFFEVNQAALRILGYDSADQITGKHPAETSAPLQANGSAPEPLSRQYIAECMEKGSAHFEWVGRNAKNQDIPLEVILTRIQMGGRPIIQAVILDITERKKAEAELLKSLAREKELSALKSNFVSMVSHEFRTPLGVIMSSAEILGEYFERLEAAERKEHLLSIQKNTRRMADLMEEVLLLSRVEAGKLVLEPHPLDLEVFCRRLVEDLLSATNARCPIELTLDPALEETYADERLLRHIFTNLLTNAIKYSPSGHPVSFRTERLGTRVRFLVVDRGIGIPDSDQKWLFNAFQRARNVGNIPGTGLGLVIVKRCVELHRGAIRIESSPGTGTTVYVDIPTSLAMLEAKTSHSTTFLRNSGVAEPVGS